MMKELTKNQQWLGSRELQLTKPKEISAAFTGTQISVAKKQDMKSTIMLIGGLVLRLASQAKVKRGVENEAEAAAIAKMIIDHYPLKRISEIEFVFSRAVLGAYGKIFDRLDANIILGFIADYEKSDEQASFYEKRQSKYREHRGEDELAIAYRDYRSGVPQGKNPLSYRDWFYQVRCQPIEPRPRKPVGRDWINDPEYRAERRRYQERQIKAKKEKEKIKSA